MLAFIFAIPLESNLVLKKDFWGVRISENSPEPQAESFQAVSINNRESE